MSVMGKGVSLRFSTRPPLFSARMGSWNPKEVLSSLKAWSFRKISEGRCDLKKWVGNCGFVE